MKLKLLDKGKEGLKKNWKKICMVAALFAVCFFMGRGVGVQKERITAASAPAKSGNWGLGFGESGSQPTGTQTADELKKYDAYYVGNKDDKTIYLTFDCGYENGNTPAILDALKKHNAQATFFVVGNFVKDNPDLIKRMVEENHTVGNHTYHHPDVTNMSQENFQQELSQVEEEYKNITGQEMTKYYRCPQGKYSPNNLQMAKDMGYKTFFWSLAYVDWNQDSQPTKEQAFDKLTTRVHPGAIVLLHNTSKTNGEILDELLTKWEGMGYHFEPLSKLCGENSEKGDTQNPEKSEQKMENTEQKEDEGQQESQAVPGNTDTGTKEQVKEDAKQTGQEDAQNSTKAADQANSNQVIPINIGQMNW